MYKMRPELLLLLLLWLVASRCNSWTLARQVCVEVQKNDDPSARCKQRSAKSDDPADEQGANTTVLS